MGMLQCNTLYNYLKQIIVAYMVALTLENSVRNVTFFYPFNISKEGI
jgi:hypothetical protein